MATSCKHVKRNFICAKTRSTGTASKLAGAVKTTGSCYPLVVLHR